ncbi:MAG TPA: hypothetical protein VGA75_13020 [Paracoccaceae bacterium]
MEWKRRIALSAALLAAGLAAGHLVQNRAAKPQAQARLVDPKPEAIVPLVADAVAVTATPAGTAAPAESAMPALPAQAMTLAPEPPVLVTAGGDCVVRLDLSVQPLAMLEVTMTAPCRPGERVVLRHGGLAITEKTSSTGLMALTLPAMDRAGVVSVLFADGAVTEARAEVPEMAAYRRFGVQWLAEDAFQVHAFEGAAEYGMPGHISAADPQQPLPGVPARGGFLSLLGQDQVDLPMLAEVYTYPAAPDGPVHVVVEAAVTPKTCGRELLGETVTSLGGKVLVADLTVAMPDCEAAGDILVLKNLVPEMKIAAR